jgi:hypothetical protein
MQDADRIAHVQVLALPARRRRPRVNVERFVLSSQRFAWCCRHCRRRWNLGQHSAVRPPEAQLTDGLSFDLEALFVNCAMVSPTQHREIRQGGRPAVRPVLNVMALAEGPATAGEATAFVPMVKRAP